MDLVVTSRTFLVLDRDIVPAATCTVWVDVDWILATVLKHGRIRNDNLRVNFGPVGGKPIAICKYLLPGVVRIVQYLQFTHVLISIENRLVDLNRRIDGARFDRFVWWNGLCPDADRSQPGRPESKNV